MTKSKQWLFDVLKALAFSILFALALFFLATPIGFIIKKNLTAALLFGQSALFVLSAFILFVAAIGFLKREGFSLSPKAKETFPIKNLPLEWVLLLIGLSVGLLGGCLDYLL